MKKKYVCNFNCGTDIKYIQDTLYVVSGKWKVPIIVSLSTGHKRYREIAKSVPNITFRMLSKELKELELNKLVTRKVYDDMPVRIEYEVTEYCKTLWPLLGEMISWAKHHRTVI